MERGSENLLRARRKRVVSELLKGREMATKLQTLLLRNPGNAAAGDRSGSPSSVHGKLSLEIFRSFSDAISQLNNCCIQPPPHRQIVSHDSDHRKCWSDEPARRRVEDNETLPPGRTGRGGYKRRKNSGETWTNVCKTMEDGYAWRKYGQKQIHNSLHPRCYYRCTKKDREGCKATKQVQRISNDEFQTTYFGTHNCTHSHNNNNNNPFNQQEEQVGDLESSSSFYYYYDDHDDHYNVKTAEAAEESPLAEAAAEASFHYPHQEMSSVVDDIDYERCFENLDNLFRSEEMPLAFLDDKD